MQAVFFFSAVRFFLLLACCLTYSLVSYGDIYLRDPPNVSEPVINPNNASNLIYYVTVNYRIPYHDDDEREDEYSRVGITDHPIGEGKYKQLLPDLRQYLKSANGDGLRNFLAKTDGLPVQGTGTGGSEEHFNLGDWPARKNPKDEYVDATFTLWLKKDEMQKVNEFCFYVVAQEEAKEEPDDDDDDRNRDDDDGPFYYRDSMPVCLPGYNVAQVKISGLSDVALSDDNLSAEIDTCVYSTTGKAKLTFDSTNTEVSNKFRLKGSADNTIFYSLAVREGLTGHNWQEDFNEGAGNISNKIWNVNNTDEDCQGNKNMSFRVSANHTGNKPAGVYSDTMTVTVSPAY